MTATAGEGSAALASALAGFYALGDDGSDPYLAGKSALRSAQRELADAWIKVRGHLAPAHTVLDWGCRHGVFAWLARRELGDAAALYGCDICPPEQYAGFHAASRMAYFPLAHPWQLPYADQSFDVVLAGGTLEHVPNDGASLAELWRVLKPHGRLILTHLPNAQSASEWWSRRFLPAQAHPRRYRLPALRERLLGLGFLPVAWGRHQMLPATLPNAAARPRSARLVERLYAANGTLERLWPLNRLSATLWLVAEKRLGF